MGRRALTVEKGKVFGRLKVLEVLSTKDKRGFYQVKCLCSCGKEYICDLSGLLRGNNKSCGCLYNETLKKCMGLTHGMSYTKLYRAWEAMRRRCKNSKDISFKNYGARGIKVCDEWNNPEVFIKWALNNGYSPGLTIDRIDNDGNYCPDNCQWITKSENTRKANVQRRKAA
jgi:hypothetical protein